MAKIWGTPRIVKLFAKSPKPFVFSRIRPNFRIKTGFSKFIARAGMNAGEPGSATKRGSFFGSVLMNAGSMVRLFSGEWQVPQVLPLPLNCSLKKSFSPWQPWVW